MEIGALAILSLIGLGILFVEHTNTGDRFLEWVTKNFIGIDINDMED